MLLEEQIESILNIYSHGESLFGNCIDLTSLKTYTIDDDSTTDIDDAISLEYTDAGAVIWVHIANPSEYFELESPLDIYARQRATSIYLADSVVPMFPLELITRAFSLLPGKQSLTLSIKVVLGDHGQIESYCICKSFIKPNYKLTYDDADDLIELSPPEEKELSDLFELLKLRQNWRRDRGSIILDNLQGRFVDSNTNPRLKVIEITKARTLISEAMILIGNIVAIFGKENKIALPYRGQNPSRFNFKSNILNFEDPILYKSLIKSQLNRAVISTNPIPHSSLGLNEYTQATSPIRRYSDTLVHRQIINQIEGKIVLSQEELTNILDEIKNPIREANNIAKADQLKCLKSWFNSRSDMIFNCNFIRWIKKTEIISLVRVNAIEMDIVCKLDTQFELRFAQELSLQYADNNFFELENDILEFKIIDLK